MNWIIVLDCTEAIWRNLLKHKVREKAIWWSCSNIKFNSTVQVPKKDCPLYTQEVVFVERWSLLRSLFDDAKWGRVFGTSKWSLFRGQSLLAGSVFAVFTVHTLIETQFAFHQLCISFFFGHFNWEHLWATAAPYVLLYYVPLHIIIFWSCSILLLFRGVYFHPLR